MKINVKIPFTFNDKNGFETKYLPGLREISDEYSFHPWVLLHAEVVEAKVKTKKVTE